MKILFFTLDYHPGRVGGAERQAQLQAEELVHRGHDVQVVCPRSAGQRSSMIGGVNVVRLPRIFRKPLNRLSYMLVLLPWLLARGRRYDVWHVHLASTQADLAVAVGLLLGKPTYVKIASGGETGEIQVFAHLSWLTRRVGLRRATRVQALSEQIVDELRGIEVARERIIRVPNGVDLDHFKAADADRKRALRAKLGLPQDRVIALYTGRFAEYKGIGELLEAWTRVPEAEGLLVLVGERTNEDQPLKLPARGNGVVTRGWSPDVVEYLQAADVFVYPAHQDGMSNSLLEAMACGLAPVTTAIGSVSAFLEHRRNALLVPPRDPDALGRSLRELIRDGDLRASVGAGAAQTASSYAVSDVVSQIERTYQEIARAC